MVDAITLHEEDDSDSWPPVALMGIEATPCVVAFVTVTMTLNHFMICII